MAKDQRKRQKRLERRAAKRKEKRQVIVKEQSAGMATRMTEAAQYPVLESFAMEGFWTSGIGSVLLSRQLPNGMIAVAFFLVDRFCLGVKDAHAEIIGRFTYDSKYGSEFRSRFPVRKLSPAAVRKLVESAVAYARDLGLAPHADYQKAKPLFGDIAASECTEEFEFGEDGKPHFIGGPHDDRQRCQMIIAQLSRACGEGNYHFTIPVSPSELDEMSLAEEDELDEMEDEVDERWN